MNLFILSLDPRKIAEYMMDKHISKIILEAVQMLCSALRVLEPDDEEIDAKVYKMAHKNHPVTIWCRTSRENFEWTLELIECMHTEWKWRYNHKEDKKLTRSHARPPQATKRRRHPPDRFSFFREKQKTKNNKKHKSYVMAEYLKEKIPAETKFPEKGLTKFALAMPDEYKCEDPVKAYRDYYMSPEKQKIASWNKKRSMPEWYIKQSITE